MEVDIRLRHALYILCILLGFLSLHLPIAAFIPALITSAQVGQLKLKYLNAVLSGTSSSLLYYLLFICAEAPLSGFPFNRS